MSAFKALQNVCLNFESELRQVSQELYSAKIGDTFEDSITKKLQDLSLFSAKLKLLRAKPLSLTPQITEQPKSEQTLKEYGDGAAAKVLEQVLVKTLTHTHAVKKLVTTPDDRLDPEMVERKRKLLAALSEYGTTETQLRHMETVLKEKEEEYLLVRDQWDKELTDLRDMREEADDDEEMDTGPLYPRMHKLLEKLELMRWMLGRLVTTRGRRDWLAEPRRALDALKLARVANTLEMFTQ
ncbi:hypothetical protein O3G_MSEX000031 [Manduca sexta]|nr:hypothetical protein O3G_MSEX000031 [Manduca sexta]